MATLTPLQSPVAAPRPVRRPWNTLDRLTHSRTGLLVLTAILLATTITARQVHSDTLTLVGKDTVPSIIQAQKIKTALADMDSDAADELLNPGGTRTAALFDARRIDASNALVEAAKNVTYEAEKEPIDTIEVVMGTYERLVQQARDYQEEAQLASSKPDVDSRIDLEKRYYRAAAIIMDGTLLPAADALDKANNDVLTQEFESRSTRSLLMRLLMLVVGVGTLIALVMAQLYLSRRTQRTLNPALLGATFVALILTLYAFSAMSREQSDLQAAKSDAFASIHALLQARAVAYSANSDESRFLLDPAHAEEYKRAFDQKSALLIHTAARTSSSQLMAQLNSGGKVAGFTGYLADEMNNITFAGERDAAVDNVFQFQNYLFVDGELRTLENQSLALEAGGQHDQAVAKHAEAVAKDVGNQREDQSDYAFNQFDESLGHTLAINQTEYDRAIGSATDAIAKLDWVAGISALLMAVLIFFGFAPRIREYQ